MYITGKKSGSDFTVLSPDNWLRSDFSKEEKDESVKTAFEGIITATPESVTVKTKKKEREYRKGPLSSKST